MPEPAEHSHMFFLYDIPGEAFDLPEDCVA